MSRCNKYNIGIFRKLILFFSIIIVMDELKQLVCVEIAQLFGKDIIKNSLLCRVNNFKHEYELLKILKILPLLNKSTNTYLTNSILEIIVVKLQNTQDNFNIMFHDEEKDYVENIMASIIKELSGYFINYHVQKVSGDLHVFADFELCINSITSNYKYITESADIKFRFHSQIFPRDIIIILLGFL